MLNWATMQRTASLPLDNLEGNAGEKILRDHEVKHGFDMQEGNQFGDLPKAATSVLPHSQGFEAYPLLTAASTTPFECCTTPTL